MVILQRSVVEMILENAQGDGEKAIELLLGMADDQNLPKPVVEPEPSKTSLSYVSATLLSPRPSSASPVSTSPSPASVPMACTPPLSPLTIPQPSPDPPGPHADLQQGHLVFVILRGLPGSGKSSLATR
jgi:predicted component of type VI protein secretion system